MNDLEWVDIIWVSGHPQRTTGDGARASQGWRFFGKSRVSPRFFSGNPWDRAKNCLKSPKLAQKSQKCQKVFLKVVSGFWRYNAKLSELHIKNNLLWSKILRFFIFSFPPIFLSCFAPKSTSQCVEGLYYQYSTTICQIADKIYSEKLKKVKKSKIRKFLTITN